MAGLKLMRVRVVRLWKWFIGCTLLLVWFSVFFGFAFMEHYQDSFIYLGGMHGYNVSRWLISQVGVPGVWMILLITAICFFIYISARTIIWLRKLFALSFLKRKKKEEVETIPAGGDNPEFTTSQPQEVEFNLKRTYKQTPPPAAVVDVQSEEEEEFPTEHAEPDEPSSAADGSEGVTILIRFRRYLRIPKMKKNPDLKWNRQLQKRNIRALNWNLTTRLRIWKTIVFLRST